jgi:hypothetical protein
MSEPVPVCVQTGRGVIPCGSSIHCYNLDDVERARCARRERARAARARLAERDAREGVGE